jgi:hypothetical protein
MSAGAPQPAGAPRPSAPGGDELFDGLPRALRPREQGSGESTGRRRRIETAVLLAVGVFLLVATINDLSRQQGVNARLNADLRSWRAYTGHPYQNLLADTQLLGPSSGREVVCGNTSPGPPKARTQICLLIWGPIVNGRRQVHGGWYLPPGSEDLTRLRYGCFGTAAGGYCRR